jgi:hypothetical protein
VTLVPALSYRERCLTRFPPSAKLPPYELPSPPRFRFAVGLRSCLRQQFARVSRTLRIPALALPPASLLTPPRIRIPPFPRHRRSNWDDGTIGSSDDCARHLSDRWHILGRRRGQDHCKGFHPGGGYHRCKRCGYDAMKEKPELV